jgi:hypothetical protein
MTIGQLMASVLVVALGLAPVVLVSRSPEDRFIIAAVAFEVILLPVILALLVLALMRPGRARDWVVASLCMAPFILGAAVGVSFNLVRFVLDDPIFVAVLLFGLVVSSTIRSYKRRRIQHQ